MKANTNLDVMIEDLIRKYPLGADKSLTKADYVINEVFSPHYDGEYKVAECEEHKLFKYDIEDYARLNFATGDMNGGMRNYLSDLYP